MRNILVGLLFLLPACGSMRLTNEDAGGAILASDVTVPANGKIVYTVERRPNTDEQAQRYYESQGVNRRFLGWWGVPAAGSAKSYVGQEGS